MGRFPGCRRGNGGKAAPRITSHIHERSTALDSFYHVVKVLEKKTGKSPGLSCPGEGCTDSVEKYPHFHWRFGSGKYRETKRDGRRHLPPAISCVSALFRADILPDA